MAWDSTRILTSPEILSEDHLPGEIHAREGQLQQIALCLRPLVESGKPMNCWLYGKPGVGKTATARMSLRKLANEAGIRGVYVNCWENPTFFSVLECIARELRLLGAEKLSSSFKLERLKRRLSGERVVLVLDEIDQAPRKERNATLYNLADVETAGLICVCNSQHAYFGLEERVKSRLNPRRVAFEDYTEDDLFHILNRRAQAALAPGSYSDDLVRGITRLTAGDARIAIQTLKHAAFLAEKDGQREIREEDVRQAWHSAKDLKKTFLLRRLTDHHRLLYELIARNPGILSGNLWRLYLKTCGSREIKPIAVRTYSDYCNELAEVALVEVKRAAIQGKVREFKPAGL